MSAIKVVVSAAAAASIIAADNPTLTAAIIIIIIIITHLPYFTAVQLVLKTVQVSLTKHFLFTVQPKLIKLYGMYQSSY